MNSSRTSNPSPVAAGSHRIRPPISNFMSCPTAHVIGSGLIHRNRGDHSFTYAPCSKTTFVLQVVDHPPSYFLENERGVSCRYLVVIFRFLPFALAFGQRAHRRANSVDRAFTERPYIETLDRSSEQAWSAGSPSVGCRTHETQLYDRSARKHSNPQSS